MKRTLLLDVAATELPSVRARLSSATRPALLRRVRFEVHDDGRATFAAATVMTELARVLQSSAVAAGVSVTGSLALNWMYYEALPIGFTVGAAWCALTMTLDRRRLRAAARRFLRAAASSS